MPGKRLANTLPLAWQQKESSHSSWAPYKMGFFLWKGVIVKRSAHKHNTVNYLCSRKWGWHRSLDSAGDPAASVPLPPPVPPICRWARQAAVLAGSSSAAFILEPSFREKLTPVKYGKVGGTAAGAKSLTGWHEPGTRIEVRVKQPPGEWAKHFVLRRQEKLTRWNHGTTQI